MWEVQAPGVASCILGLEENLGSSEQLECSTGENTEL